MRLNCRRLLAAVTLMFMLVSCQSELEQHKMQVRLCLPVHEQSVSGQRRVMGDPGTYEQFALPRYAYVFILRQNGDSWQLWKKEERSLDENNWTRTHYSGTKMTAGDSIFMYNVDLGFLQMDRTTRGRVYTICSNKRLTFNPAGADISSPDDVLDLKFNTAPDSIQENLQNIYSTPYNYLIDGDYYCSFDCRTDRGLYIDMVLYHVASKVDLKWNVVDSMRINLDDPSEAVRLTYMDARRLYNGYAYCFRPLRNTLPALPVSGYDIHIVTPADEGLWWEGRTYFYTIPYTVIGAKDYFPLQLLMRTNDTGGTGYQLTLNQPIDTTNVFVPWIRGDFKITNPLDNKAETKVIEEP